MSAIGNATLGENEEVLSSADLGTSVLSIEKKAAYN